MYITIDNNRTGYGDFLWWLLTEKGITEEEYDRMTDYDQRDLIKEWRENK